MGLMFIILIVMLTMSLSTVLCRPLEKRIGFIRRRMESWRADLHWNGYIRLIIEGCLEIFTASSLNIAVNTQASYSNGTFFYSWQGIFNIVNNVTLIILSVIAFLSFFVMAVFYVQNFDKWDDEEFEGNYGAVYEDLKRDSKWNIIFPIIFIARRALFIIVIVFVPINSFVIFIMMVLSIFSLMYLIRVKPFEELKMQKFEVFNEVVLLAQTYVILSF